MNVSLKSIEPISEPLKSARKKIGTYLKYGKFKEAKKIGKIYPDDPIIQEKLILLYEKQNQHEKIKEIEERFSSNILIQNLIIAVYRRKENYIKAKEIGKRFPYDSSIQNQILLIYLKEGKIKEAKEIGERFPDDITIQSQMIKFFISEEDMKSAKNIAERFPKSEIIQSQLLEIYIKENNLNESYTIAKNFPNNKIIQRMLSRYNIETLKSDNIIANRINQQKRFKDIIQIISSNPNDRNLKSLIEEENDSFIKALLCLALYDKLNQKEYGKNLLISLKRDPELYEKNKKVINILYERFQQTRKTIFDKGFYLDLPHIMTQYETRERERE